MKMLSQAISAAKENKFEEYGYVVLVSCLAVLRPALDRYTSLRAAMSMDVSQFLTLAEKVVSQFLTLDQQMSFCSLLFFNCKRVDPEWSLQDTFL